MRILFVKLGAIGDLIQSAVALTAHRVRFPDTVVDWVTGIGMAPLVAATGIADRIVEIDERALITGSLPARIFSLARAMAVLRRQCAPKYDGVYTAYMHPRAPVLTFAVRSRIRKTMTNRGERPNNIYHRSRVHEYWRLLTAEDSGRIDIVAATADLGRRVLRSAAAVTAPSIDGDYVVVVAGGARNLHRDDPLRRWPIENYRRLVERLLQQGRQVVLVGAPSDQWISESMQGLPVEDLIGKTTLLQLLVVMQRAAAVVSSDTGGFHLAALTTTGLVGLFGPTPANAVAPMGRPNMRILASDNRVSCSPCYDGRNFAACARNVCLESITVDAVVAAIEEVACSGAADRGTEA